MAHQLQPRPSRRLAARDLPTDRRLWERLFRSALQDLRARFPLSPEESLSEEEAALLRDGGFTLEPGENRALAAGRARFAALVETGLSVQQVAEHLGVTPARVRQMLTERSLFGIRDGRRWTVPRFQLAERGVVPGLPDVLRVLPRDLHPVTFYGFFTEPSSELRVDGEWLSPRDWLLGGHPRDPIVALAEGLGQL